jgi:hypothetical protein
MGTLRFAHPTHLIDTALNNPLTLTLSRRERE